MLLQNFVQAYRKLKCTPSFTLATVLTLALSIGASTSIFSVAYNILIKSLPYPHPDQLVTIHESIHSGQATFSSLPVNANHLVYWQRNNRSFSHLAAVLPLSMVSSEAESEQVQVLQATANLFPALGVHPRLGRDFRMQDEEPGRARVVILTDNFWRRRYNADPTLLGRAIRLDGKPYEVIGIMAPGLVLPQASALGGSSRLGADVQAFVLFAWTVEVLQEVEGDHNYFAIGRLKPGVGAASAQSELAVLQHAISQRAPDKLIFGASVKGLQEYLTGGSKNSLLLLLSGVGMLMLIACVNVANLLLARASSRTIEVATRTALGASAFDLVATALTEPILLAAGGGFLGAVLATLALPSLLRIAPPELPRLGEVHVDGYAFMFATTLSAMVAFFCGAFPARRFARSLPEPVLRSEGHHSSHSRQTKWSMQALVVGEVSASVALLVIGGLFLVSIVRLLHVDAGFSPEHVVTAQVLLPGFRYGDKSERNQFYERVLSSLRQTPGVQTAGFVSVLPLDGDNWGDLVSAVSDRRLWCRGLLQQTENL